MYGAKKPSEQLTTLGRDAYLNSINDELKAFFPLGSLEYKCPSPSGHIFMTVTEGEQGHFYVHYMWLPQQKL